MEMNEGPLKDKRVQLAHGGGGLESRHLVEEVMLKAFGNARLNQMGDSALLAQLTGRLAMSTDGYVVRPRFFPGGNIGKLAVCGTVNDLAVAGARPLYLSVAMIIEEGLPMDELVTIVQSMADAALDAGITIVTGDTKVVPRGQADGLYITTAGVGSVPKERELSPSQIAAGDRILISGTIGDHGLAILAAREGLASFTHHLVSDCAPLGGLVETILAAAPGTRCMRDPTRGGVAAVVNEWAASGGCTLRLWSDQLPIHEEADALCDALGFDPLHLANEGKLLAIIPADQAETALQAARQHPLGHRATIIGEVVKPTTVARATIRTPYGTERILDWPSGELLPRIC